ncbi:MAG TPA: transketolase [Spirochaetia bacterium]|nr:transketolase [Spirochaetales bacterium]HRY79242.1 transketolase [Spirochaetia bacterium]HRZ90909.1 transketolase [Spirochaetia bacterium]
MINPSPDRPALPAELADLAVRARSIRRACLESIAALGVGHVGGSMSVVEALAVLYFRHMRLDPGDAKSPDRDRFVLSKGHAGPALYAALAEKGYLDRPLLLTLNKGGTSLPSHADRQRTPGVDMSTGSLGQGFSAACGIALGLRMDGPRADGTVRRCWTVIGDGESDEGQVWEAAAFAAHYRLSNLVAFTDANRFQIDGATEAVMHLRDLSAKWSAFGWRTFRVDGHDLGALDRTILSACSPDPEADGEGRGRPAMIVLDTVKAKGVPALEGKAESHNAPFGPADLEAALDAMDKEAPRG